MTGNIFSPGDIGVIRAFCTRESHQYRFVNDYRRQAFAKRLVKKLMDHVEENPEFNFARIQSLTNMGTLQDELVLSTQHLGHDQGDICFVFPPSPNGSISVQKRKE